MTKIKKGDSIKVNLDLEFEGTIRNYAVFLEDQFIPTNANHKATDVEIKVDGDPLKLYATFAAIKGAKIKKIELTVNSVVGLSYKDIIFKGEQITIEYPLLYSVFNLEETN